MYSIKTIFCTLILAASSVLATAQEYKKASPDTRPNKENNGGTINNGGGAINSGGGSTNGGNSNGGGIDDNFGNNNFDDPYLNNGGNNNNNGGNNGARIDPKDCKMNRIDMEATRALLGRIRMESEKMETAQSQLKGRCATAAQIAEVMAMFMGEISKSEFAKFAYNHCSDPENSVAVENALMSEMSKSEIRRIYSGKSNPDDNFGNNNFDIPNNFDILNKGGNNNGGGNNNFDAKDCKMNRINMEATRELLKRITFESEKIATAKNQLKDKCATAAQIAEVMGMFMSELNKVEFAKFARSYCSDPQNSVAVESALMSEISKSEIRKLYK